MRRLLEDDATDFERMLLGSIEMDVPPEGAAAALIDRLESAPVVPLANARKKLRHSTWLFLVAAAIGGVVFLLSRARHKDEIPIVQEQPSIAPVSSDVPAMEMSLPAPAPSLAVSARPAPAPSVRVVKRSAPMVSVETGPAAALSTLLRETTRDAGAFVAQEFDRGFAARALGHVDLGECRQFDGPSGAGHVVVTFAPEGNVQRATVDPPFAGTARGACIAAKFAAVRVPPFQGAPIRVGKSFVLQ